LKKRTKKLLPVWARGAAAACFCLLPLFSSAQSSSGLKRPLVGLISMGQDGLSPRNDNARFFGIPGTSLDDLITKRNAFDGVVINIPWIQLQPDPGGALDTARIDRTLDEMRRYNADPRTTVALRAILRVWAGVNAPDWVKAIDGGPVVTYSGDRAHRPMPLPHFWSLPYEQAWRALQDRLAAHYDQEPLIAQVANTACTSDDDEPNALARFNDRRQGVSSIRALHEAGFTDAAFSRCMTDALRDYEAWHATPVNFTLGPVFRIDGLGDFQLPPRDAAFTDRLVATIRSTLGPRAVLANHNLNYPLNERVGEVYEAIREAGGQIEFQTHSPRGLDWGNTVKEAVCLGAHALELWNSTGAGGYVDFPATTLIAWSNELKHTTSNELCPSR
jgi:hypothetical protein